MSPARALIAALLLCAYAGAAELPFSGVVWQGSKFSQASPAPKFMWAVTVSIFALFA